MNNKFSPRIAFGQRLREKRTESGLTQEELAGQAGLDRTYVSSCERGKRNVSLENIYKISLALNISPKELLPEPVEAGVSNGA